jgi:glycosyltransferase involved in cell wall biosynthesis
MTLNNINISVIIPVKNRASLLPQTLNNILNQTLKPYEIIVVDDNSTDNLQSVIDLYKDKVLFVKNNNGNGPGAARNLGFKISTGSYIQFFDSDDLMTKKKMEVQGTILKNTGSGMTYCPYFKASTTLNSEWKQESPLLYYYPLSKSLRYDQWVIRGACMITQACLFDKNIFKETGLWRTDLMTHEDLEILFRIGKIVPFPIHSNEVSVLYRQHGEQLTDKSSTNESKTIDQFNAWNIIAEEMNSKNYSQTDFIINQQNLFHSYSHIDNKEKISLQKKFNAKNKIFDIANRIYKKYNRLISNSEWLPVHRILNSKEKIDGYIKDLE